MPARLSFPPTPAARAGPPRRNQTATDKTHASFTTTIFLKKFFRISHLHNSFTDFIIIYLLLIRFTKCNRTTSVMSRDMGVRTDQKNMHAKTAV